MSRRHREDLDQRLARIKGYRNLGTPTVSLDSPTPKRGIGTDIHIPKRVGHTLSKMDVLQWVKGVFIAMIITAGLRLIANRAGWLEVSMGVGIVGGAIMSIGTLLVIGGLIKIKWNHRKASTPRRGVVT